MKQVDSIRSYSFIFSVLLTTLSVSGMQQEIPQRSYQVPSLKDLALSAIVKKITPIINDTSVENLDQTLQHINSQTDRLPDDSRNDLTARLGNYRCANTFSMGAHSRTPLLFTRLRILVSNAGKKINLYGIDDDRKQPISALDAHSQSVTALALSQTGSLLVSGSHDTTIKLWNIEKPQEPVLRTTLTEHGNSISKLLLAYDDTILFSASTDGTAIIWDISDPNNVQQLATIPIHFRAVKTAIVAPDGMSILYGENTHIKRLDIDTIQEAKPQEVEIFKNHLITSLACFRNQVAMGSSDKKIRIYENTQGGPFTHIATLQGHTKTVHALEFSDTGKLLASGSSDKKIKLWAINSPDKKQYLRTLFGHKDTVKKLQFIHNDNQLVSISDDKNVILWDVTDPMQATRLKKLHGHSLFLTDLAHDRTDQTRLLTKAADRTIKIWHPTSVAYAVLAQAINSVNTRNGYESVLEHIENNQTINDNEKEALTDLLQAQKKYINKSS